MAAGFCWQGWILTNSFRITRLRICETWEARSSSLIVFSFVIIAGYFVAFDLMANALNFSPAGRLMGGQALLRGIPSLENLYSLQSNEQTFSKRSMAFLQVEYPSFTKHCKF